MTYQTVDVLVVDTTPQASPLASVVIKVLSQDGRLVYGQPTTGTNGRASLLLPPGVYQLRFFRFGVTFWTQLIEVIEGATNQFTVRGEVYTYPQSTDARICIASGFFRSPTGGIARGVDMHFIAKWNPILLDGSAIMPERVTQRSDNTGYVEVPLIRYGQYDVTIEGMEDYLRCISVPNTPAVNISDLLFPAVASILFEEEGPYTVAQGQTLYLTPHVYATDLNELTNILADVLWSTTDSVLLALDTSVPGKIGVRGSQPGTYELRADRKDKTIIRIPNTPIQGVPVTVTVTL